MRSLGVLLRTSVLLLAVAFAASSAGPAYAEEDSALSSLTPEERQVLEARVPDWATMTSDQKERIARNVIRLRSLTPEDRKRFQDRVDAMRRHREQHGRMPDVGKRFRNPKMREEMRRRGRIAHAIGAAMWADLPEETRRALDAQLGGDGRRRLSMAFAMRLSSLTAKEIVAGEVPALPEGLSDHLRERLEPLHAKAVEGDEKAKLRVAYALMGHRTNAFAEEIEGVDRNDQEALTRIGRKIRDLRPTLFAAAVDELVEASASPQGLKGYMRKSSPRRGGGSASRGGRGERLAWLHRMLKETLPSLERAGDPELYEAAQRFEKLLRRKLGASEAGAGSFGDERGRGPGGRGPGRRPGGRGPGPRGGDEGGSRPPR